MNFSFGKVTRKFNLENIKEITREGITAPALYEL
jgi:hypothetical protein